MVSLMVERNSPNIMPRTQAGAGAQESFSGVFKTGMASNAGTRFKQIGGIRRDDEMLASFIAGSSGPIDTTNQINWEATGTATLTQEQIEDIKGRYNINDMTSQEYYDLLCELTQLNVVSPDECVGTYVGTAVVGPMGAMLSPTPLLGGVAAEGTGNPIKNLRLKMDAFSELLDWMSSKGFDRVNGGWSSFDHYQERQKVLGQYSAHEKLYEILMLLQ